MREQLQTRIEALKRELEAGQAARERVERQRTYLHETALRISGAIQVLQELMADGEPDRRDAVPVTTPTAAALEDETNPKQVAFQAAHPSQSNGRGGVVC